MAYPLSLTLVVNKFHNRLLYAESNGDFVDILVSFLTLPLGSIPGLTKLPFGSISNLWESVQNLNSDCFFNEACRSMLLRPLNSPVNPFTALPVSEDDDGGGNSCHQFRFYYICSDCRSSLSFCPNIPCECGKLMDRKMEFVADAVSGNYESCVFVKPSFKFIITDGLLVVRSSTELANRRFSNIDRNLWNSLESMRADVTPEKILELLKRLLVSDTPLTDVFLGGHCGSDKLQQFGGENCTKTVKQISSKRISMKLYLNKKDNTLLFCESGKEFTELLASFLTYPMGSVVHWLGGRSGFPCIDTLYRSIDDLKLEDCFKSRDLINILLQPTLPQHYKLKDPLMLQIYEPYDIEKFYMCGKIGCKSSEVTNDRNILCKVCKKDTWRQLILIDQKLSSTRYERPGEYLKSSLYMITDELGITQMPSLMLIADKLNRSANEITERTLEIGEDEALALLRASISSRSVLTDVLMGKELGKRP